MMPELDSHNPSKEHPEPLSERFSPWHAAGPSSAYPNYSAAMSRHAHLHLLTATLRLAAGDKDTIAAARQWLTIFGIQCGRHKAEVQFTNATVAFVPGESGKPEGLVEVAIGVESSGELDKIMERAVKEDLKVYENCVEMLGVRWRFVSMECGEGTRSRL
jgi:hypothetical protein